MLSFYDIEIIENMIKDKEITLVPNFIYLWIKNRIMSFIGRYCAYSYDITEQRNISTTQNYQKKFNTLYLIFNIA